MIWGGAASVLPMGLQSHLRSWAFQDGGQRGRRENGDGVVLCCLRQRYMGGGETGIFGVALLCPGEVMGCHTEVETSSGWAEQCGDPKTAP